MGLFRIRRITFFLLLLFAVYCSCRQAGPVTFPHCDYDTANKRWTAGDPEQLPDTGSGAIIRYGHDLFVRTSFYFGPNGKIASISNGMNCQNCHLSAGTRAFSNCLSAAASSYPGFRPRSGIIESLEFRVNDCMQRSLNGHPIDSNSKEMHALTAYLHWLGDAVPPKQKPVGAGIPSIAYLDRAADTLQGKNVFETRCLRCHGANGEGQTRPDGTGFIYPPLWGNNSFNDASGILRLSKLAGFIKYSMPFDSATHDQPSLRDEEAWDVAAYIVSKPRPSKVFPGDWPDISKKPADHPFGPFTDHYSMQQHKYGPFAPIDSFHHPAKK